MAKYIIIPILFAVSCLLFFSACQLVNDSEQNSIPGNIGHTTILTTNCSVTTTTAATTTTKDATISTASTTALTKPSKTATISSALTSTTADLPGDNRWYAPEEQWPEEDKRQLLVNVNGEQVCLSLDYAYINISYGESALWKYSGISKSGKNVGCTVVNGRIYCVDMQITNLSKMGAEQEAIGDFVRTELKKLGFGEISAELNVRILFNKGTGYHFGWVYVPLSETERLSVQVSKTSADKYVLISLATYHDTNEGILPGLTEHDFDYLIPNWC